MVFFSHKIRSLSEITDLTIISIGAEKGFEIEIEIKYIQYVMAATGGQYIFSKTGFSKHLLPLHDTHLEYINM